MPPVATKVASVEFAIERQYELQRRGRGTRGARLDSRTAQFYSAMHDCLIIGGGVIGLSLAYELAGDGQRVRVVDRIQPGREASWAAAGILPPASQAADADAARATGGAEHAAASRLGSAAAGQKPASTTAIAVAARSIWPTRACSANWLTTADAMAAWRREPSKICRPTQRCELEPALQPAAASGRLRAGLLVPDEVQIRSPWNLACARSGLHCGADVEISSDTEVEDFEIAGDQIRAAAHARKADRRRHVLHHVRRLERRAVEPAGSARRRSSRFAGRSCCLKTRRADFAAGRLCRPALFRAARRWPHCSSARLWKMSASITA